LTHCTLQELQKLVVATTNIMAPSNPDKSTSQKSITSDKDDASDIKTITDSEEEVIHSEPMEDVKIFDSENNQQQQSPVKTAVTSIKQAVRQDSGFHDMEVVNEKLTDA
jgi:hypothetical protein